MTSKNSLKNYEKYSQAKELLDILPIKSGDLLDVGCGQGHLVRLAKQYGFNSVGIDPLYNVSLEKYITKQKFDVITLKHVLEHIENPRPFLRKIYKLLNSGGYLLVSCPNINSLMAKIFSDRWYGLQPKQHKWHYTQNTLPKLLADSGLMIRKTVVNNMWYQNNKILFKTILLFAKYTNMGDQIIVLCQK